MGTMVGNSYVCLTLIFPPNRRLRVESACCGRHGGGMNTSTKFNTSTSGGLGFWKILAVIAVILIACAVIVPILKGLFWVALIGLALYGGFVLFGKSGQ